MTENFCPQCGQPLKLKRIDSHYVLHELNHVLHLERGIFYTIRELLLTPGKSVREFILENRSRLVTPIVFIIITSLVYSMAIHLFDIRDGYIVLDGADEDKNSNSIAIFGWINRHYGYANILVGVFVAFWLKLFFKKYNFNFFEILILLCFVMGMGMLQFAAFAFFEGLTKIPVMQIAGVVFIIYFAWAVGQFFENRKLLNCFKSLGAYCLGMVCFALSAIFLGFILDIILKTKSI